MHVVATARARPDPNLIARERVRSAAISSQARQRPVLLREMSCESASTSG